MPVKKNTATKVLRWLDRVLHGGQSFRVTITTTPEAAAKLAHLKATGRDMLQVTPQMADAAGRAYITALKREVDAQTKDGEPADPSAAIAITQDAVGESVLQTVVGRFEGKRAGATLRPLKRSTVRRKGHPRIGVDSGELKADLLAATTETKAK